MAILEQFPSLHGLEKCKQNPPIYRYEDRLEIPDRTEAHQVDYIVDV